MKIAIVKHVEAENNGISAFLQKSRGKRCTLGSAPKSNSAGSRSAAGRQFGAPESESFSTSSSPARGG